jgi:hypothetical protein
MLGVLGAPSVLASAALAGAGGSDRAVVDTTAATNVCASRKLLCPDLIMSAPSEFHLDRSTRPGRLLLRATSSVDNHGRGPLELRAHRRLGGRWRVEQAIYGVHGRVRLIATPASLVFKYVPGERYEYGDVGAARYWKLHHAAAFQLWSLGPHFKAERLVRTGPKVDYCLRDLERTRPVPRSPTAAHYPGCSQERGIHHDKLGTSVGWSDIYPYSYPQQWIDVTGLRGRFAFVQIADPDGLLTESNERNNVSETYVALPSGRILGHRVGVAGP